MTTHDEFAALLATAEGGRFEFKEARGSYDFEKFLRYCIALANEGGGKIILGVTDKRPRRVVGTGACAEPGRTEAGIFERLHRRVAVEELWDAGRRVLIFHVPSRAPGSAWQYAGSFWMRAGDALVPMTDDQLRGLHSETGPDFSAEICPGATVDDLDPAAVDLFRSLWRRKMRTTESGELAARQLLRDSELIGAGGLTYAALVLLGRREALGRYLGQAELVVEYRSSDVAGPAADRREFRQGFLPVLDEVWKFINLRNDRQHFQQGLFVWDVPTFDERAVREGILNAVSHRDYRSGGSVFIRQFPRRIEIVSPGGFPPGITTDNLLWQQNPRNRRIAEALSKCGLVERAGQGFDLIYRECIRQGKRSLTLPARTRTSCG